MPREVGGGEGGSWSTPWGGKSGAIIVGPCSSRWGEGGGGGVDIEGSPP